MNEATIPDLVSELRTRIDRQKEHINNTPELRNSPTFRGPIGELFNIINELCVILSEANEAGIRESKKVLQLEAELELTKNTTQSKTLQVNQNKCSVPNETEYHTDEEILAEETGEWETVIQRGHKRKKSELRSQSSNDTQKVKDKPKKVPKPPPVYIERVTSFPALKKMVEAQTPNVTFTTMSNDVVKINTHDSDGFRAVTKCFVEQKIPHYTYQNKQDRPITVMIKGIHKSWSNEEVLDDLRNQFGTNSVLKVNRKLEWKSKNPLDMCLVDFQKDLDVDKIYSINQVLKGRVTVYPIKSSKHPSQCKRCQEFHHTRNYCAKPPRCVKCAKGHFTEECTKAKDTPAKCANCFGDHTANYRGCPAAIEAMNRHKNTNKQEQKLSALSQGKSATKKFVPKTPVLCNKPDLGSTGQVSHLLPYSKVLQNQKSLLQQPSRRQSIDHTNNDVQLKINQIFEMVTNLTQSISSLNERVSRIESKRQLPIKKIP